MATSPSTSRARLTSTSSTRAWAWGLRTNAAASAPGPRSSRKRPSPATSRGSSRRTIGSPIVRVVTAARPCPPGTPLGFPGPLRQDLGGAEDRGDDVLVAGAAAEVAPDGLAGLLLGGVGVVAQVGGDGGDEPGGAEAALQAVAVLEGLLDRAEAAVGRPAALDGGDLGPVDPDREQQARTHRPPVDQHRAGPADAVLAAEMGAGQPQVVAQAVGQQPPGRHPHGVGHAVHHQPGLVQGLAHVPPNRPAAWAAAARAARAVSTPARWRR